MANIFISYSSTDKTIVKQIASILEAKGWSVWWDRQIPIGQTYDTVIEEELEKADCVLVIWTERSVASEWVRNEANEAASKRKLVPLMLENITLPLAFKRIESAMMQGWNGTDAHPELELLLHRIKSIIDKDEDPPPPPPPPPPPAKLLNKKAIITIIGAILFVGFLISYFKFYPAPDTSEHQTITIRIFDSKKNPVTQGDVKIYLKEYIRNQSIDNMGQALFTSVPSELLKNRIRVDITSPGYDFKTFDTILTNLKSLDLTLPLHDVVIISGRIKTAAEMPIKGVEIVVDGTRYSTISITDGSYSIRLEEYTLGDKITLTTSHEGYEDKTITLEINSPEIKDMDVFLQPIKP